MKKTPKEILHNWRLMLPVILLVIGVVIGAKYGIAYWVYARSHVTTDDARIKGVMVSVSPEVSGRVIELLVDEGSRVQEGQVLFRIDPTDYQVQVAQAEAVVEALRTQLREAQKDLALTLERGKREVEKSQAVLAAKERELRAEETALSLEEEQIQNRIIEAEAALKEAESRLQEMKTLLQQAETELSRLTRLYEEGIVPGERRDAAQTAFAQAQARYLSAQEDVKQAKARYDYEVANRKMIEFRRQKIAKLRAEVREQEAALQLTQLDTRQASLKEERVKILKAKLKEAEARLAAARLRLEHTTVRSPITGIVSRKRVELGEMVQRGQPVLVISDLDRVWVLSNIKETYIRDVQVGSPVDIWVDAYPDRQFQGRVETIGAAAISEFALFPPTGNFTKVEQRIPVRISVENVDGMLRPGMMVVVGIAKSKGKQGKNETESISAR
ncbi:MAG: HlyD family secretion protein [Nitrospinota bacterium]|nr:MAG: HlyD family secretion protein [Nitrospinota bacterium]